MAKAHIIVGSTGTGKTTFIKKLLSKIPSKQSIIIYDVNNEYKEFYPYKFNPDFEDFMERIIKLEKVVCVLEESTIFLNNRSCNNDLVNMLVRKRHTGNHYILVFHSLRAVPRYIYELSNYITIFKTNDSPDMTAKELKDSRLENVMNEVRNSKKNYFCKTLKIY